MSNPIEIEKKNQSILHPSSAVVLLPNLLLPCHPKITSPATWWSLAPRLLLANPLL